MLTKNVVFSNQKASATVLEDLKDRIVAVFSSASVPTPPAAGEKITFSDLNATYSAARTAIFAMSGSFSSKTLNDFTGQSISGLHGMGITEATVGELEQLCSAYFQSNKAGNNTTNFTTVVFESCPSNFSSFGPNQANYSPFSCGFCADNFANNSFQAEAWFGYSSFGSNSARRNRVFAFDNWGGGSRYYTFFRSTSNHSNFASNGNRSNNSFQGAAWFGYSNHFGSNFGFSFSNASFGDNRTNCSYTAESLYCGAYFSTDYGANVQTCTAVHSSYTVEGV